VVAWSAGERRSSPTPEAPPSERPPREAGGFLAGRDAGPIEDQLDDIAVVAVGAVGSGSPTLTSTPTRSRSSRRSAASSVSPVSTFPLGIPTSRQGRRSNVAG